MVMYLRIYICNPYTQNIFGTDHYFNGNIKPYIILGRQRRQKPTYSDQNELAVYFGDKWLCIYDDLYFHQYILDMHGIVAKKVW